MTDTNPVLLKTPLHELHVSRGARMVPFAGYDMPVQFAGIMAEHTHTRTQAGLFDVSHMGQVKITGPNRVAALEQLIPMDVAGVAEGRQRYGLLLNETGGILDDLMFANRGDHLFVVVNAACKDADIAHLQANLGAGTEVEVIEDRALLALQGPEAETALSRHAPGVRDMRFMDVANVTLAGVEAWVSRSGYTGEDGFEISVPASAAADLAQALMREPEIAPIGLGARDSLRLEAGLCLYGHDVDQTTTPVEAALTWAIQKRRRAEGGFPGAARVLAQIESGVDSRRVGLRPQGRAPMREGVVLYDAAEGGAEVGKITSGGFGPTVGAPVAMGYVTAALSAPDTEIFGEVRGKRLPVTVAPLPFVTANFKR